VPLFATGCSAGAFTWLGDAFGYAVPPVATLTARATDGSVTEIRILESSGERILDQAAVDIVQRASPFDPFPDELRGKADILEIIRTWRFHRGNSFSSGAP